MNPPKKTKSWKNNFQRRLTLQVSNTYLEEKMARLPKGEKQNRANLISRLLQRCRLGLSEQEIAAETGLDRRTVNNYLRELDGQEKVHRQGRKWFPG